MFFARPAAMLFGKQQAEQAAGGSTGFVSEVCADHPRLMGPGVSVFWSRESSVWNSNDRLGTASRHAALNMVNHPRCVIEPHNHTKLKDDIPVKTLRFRVLRKDMKGCMFPARGFFDDLNQGTATRQTAGRWF